ncbi:enoyl-CoA hydratase/isomerase family protein [Pseudooceanicola sp. CBS1P-1]|uniref:3-hydroxyacyl-CoA dehydrogenase n=1 Tax=Pseudooceanicola albus TaxID=2692189 RepID=A0A6L7G3F7_9RHOB|nr:MULTISPECIES: 3-hydroxyacyl-CoA dehydrogenase NAD-binding domain-containing protein [Pseudooceanicola]MBT9382602.1 enoyl-CoA hydratase/isomerase family protein [Pseudooceanicola endophyticus]MXN17143.1 3-hydroxyacyl-CoA dehydrogenase [Pseudooceanicola albus]
MTDFTMLTDAAGVATITWDVPGRSMNVLTLEGAEQLRRLFETALEDRAVRGIVITSGKDSFAGGMDLSVLATMQAEGPEATFEGIMAMHRLLRLIERAGMDPKTLKGGKAVAAALPGTALGIGLELPLACHRIFAADRPDAKIGLPEIQVGLFPGAGGTTRLVRKLGVMGASPFLLQGKLSDPKAAQAAGLIDAVVADPLAAARDWVLQAAEGDLVKPWDARGYKVPGGAPYSPQGFPTFVGANAMIAGQTWGAYPAPKALLSAVYEGLMVPFDTALKIEARWFTHVLMDPSASAMIRSLFLDKEALEKGANRPALPEARVRQLGVLGAGMMGAGIALVAARAGIAVTLIDQDQGAADKGKAYTQAYLEKGVKLGKTSEAQMQEVLDRITATTDYAALSQADLVIEAVFEDPKVKAEVTARACAVLGPEATFASNTSTLPISELARASTDPARFIGIHFFSPVEKMALVEIIRGKDTGDAAVARALDFVRQIRKTPIVVNDARFFYANRCIIPYLNEGARMVTEGISPALVEHAARMLGFPVGPLQLIDETSITLALKIAGATKAAMGAAYPADLAAVDALMERMAGEGRLGRKAGAGFYDYDARGKRQGLWSGLVPEGKGRPDPDLHEVQHRLMFVQVLEAVRALEEGVLLDVREGDVGAILGWGFAPWSGGPFSWLDLLGTPFAAETCDRLEAAHGPRFACPALLREKARRGGRFRTAMAEAAA